MALDWADRILKAYPERKAIVVSHDILWVDGTFTDTSGSAPRSGYGQYIYDALKYNDNLFIRNLVNGFQTIFSKTIPMIEASTRRQAAIRG